jgi:tetratricopeptide (TPR) repeat protein
MRFYFKIILFICALSSGFNALAQSDGSVADLIKQGISLNNQKKYTEASDSYKAALALEPDNVQANYQMAFTLFSAGKNAEALPFIEKATKGTNTKFTAAAYSLMGSIYQGTGQLLNAVAAYQNAIKADVSNQRIYYNLGIAYFKNKQYDDAQTTFEQAIKIDANDAGSVRMYALSAFHQNKRADAILGFCRFLLLEPNSSRSAEAFGNLENMLQGGRLKPEPAYKPSATVLAAAVWQNETVKKALSLLTARRYASTVDLLAAQLTAIFKAASADRRVLNTYFAQLAFTDNMPAFARHISQNTKPESAKWLKDNPEKVAGLVDWLKVSSAGATVK